MITISFTIPNMPVEVIVALTFVLAPLVLMIAFRFASSTASLVRQFTK